jgi:acetylornithine/succinyldiaminopimelate/putrescine aminotransferase
MDRRTAFLTHLAPTSPEPIGIEVDRAEGWYLHATDGRRYLDLLSGIGVANIGHTHPEVVAAVAEQNRRHHHVMVYGEYVQEAPARYAEELAAVLPRSLNSVYFVNSGAEAVEGALKLARRATGRAKFVAFEGAYHGDTLGALSVAGNPLCQDPFRPLVGPVEVLPFGDGDALSAIDTATAAVIVEPIQGEGGVRIPPDGFLAAVRARCDAAGALLLFDEVLTGFGRTGALYAFEHWDTVPDVLIHAKALGGGFPLGAFIADRRLMEVFTHDPPLGHVTTFGGHPVSCAAGRAALSVLLRDGLSARAARVGDRFTRALRERLGGHPSIREVRGMGLLLGLELAGAPVTTRFVERCRDRGVLVGWTLHHDHIVRLAPPLTVAEDVLDEAVEILADALDESA